MGMTELRLFCVFTFCLHIKTMRLSSLLTAGWGKIVGSLIFMLAALQLLHVVLLNRLEAKMVHFDLPNLSQKYQHIYNKMTMSLHNAHVIDSSGEFYIVRHLYGSNGYDDDVKRIGGSDKDVTVVSHSSAHLLHHIINLTETWQGPLSIGVFSPVHQLEIVLYTIVILHHCLASHRKYLTIHVAFPLSSYLPAINHFNFTMLGDELLCHKSHQAIRNIVNQHGADQDRNYGNEKLKYPNNLLRNIAVNACLTQFVLVIDIDMVPSPGLRQDFLTFISKERRTVEDQPFLQSDVVYVIPAFEIHKDCNLPGNKTMLINLWTKQCVRPFYIEMCEKCQKPTNFDIWRNLHEVQRNNLQVAFDVDWKDPWEPFFIASRHKILYDERFKQYGFNRISQVCELHIAGFKFSVLDPAFILHQGFKTPDNFHSSKDREQEENRILFRKFKEELKVKYPNTNRRCY